ncbi:MAG: DinB family protein [Gemmatimonadota bacterium]
MTQQAWLRGPVEGVIPELQPVAHSLIQAREDVEGIQPMLSVEELWTAPGGAASPGFHLRHLAGSTDRLLTYANGGALSEKQKRHLATEKEPQPDLTADLLLEELREVFAVALAHLRSVDESDLDEERLVGRGGLVSNVRGLLFHMGEHATRHVGQLITTLNVNRDRPIRPGPTAAPPEERRGHAPGGALPDAQNGR